MDRLNRIRIVPWISSQEWMDVYNNIFDSPDLNATEPPKLKDFESVSQAVKHMKLWQFRSENRLPVSVESTLIFLEILLSEDSPNAVSQYQIQVMYAMAITRFVNGLVDQQQKGAYSLPVAQLARNMDIPRFLVDIRHAATHDSLPSIHVLRRAANTALEWLFNNYWSIQRGYSVEIKTFISDLLKRYKWNRKQSLKPIEEDAMSAVPLTEDQIQIVKELVDLMPEQLCKETFCNILISNEGFLVPLARKKRCTLDGGISANLLELWQPLLQALSYSWRNLFTDLFETGLDLLSGRQFENDTSYHATLAVWVRLFIQQIGENASDAIKQGLLHCIMRTPNDYTKYLIESDAFSDLKDRRIAMLSEFASSFSSGFSINIDGDSAEEGERSTDELSQMKERFQSLFKKQKHTPLPELALAVPNQQWRACDGTAEFWCNLPIGSRI